MNSPMDMLQQFQQFKQSLQGQDPNAVLQKMLQSGQVTQAQVNQATEMAKQFQTLFK